MKTYNPYPTTERDDPPSNGWIFTNRLAFTRGLNNNTVTQWEQHLAELSFKAGQEAGRKQMLPSLNKGKSQRN